MNCAHCKDSRILRREGRDERCPYCTTMTPEARELFRNWCIGKYALKEAIQLFAELDALSAELAETRRVLGSYVADPGAAVIIQKRCDALTAEVELAHKQRADVSRKLAEVCNEKQALVENMNKLRAENDELTALVKDMRKFVCACNCCGCSGHCNDGINCLIPVE